MVKSKGKHVMMEAFPECFSGKRMGGVAAEIQITDALSWLYSSFSEKRSPVTGEVTLAFTGGYLFEKAMFLASSPLQQEGARTHVVLFDKSEFTPITKNVKMPPECYSKTSRDRTMSCAGGSLAEARKKTEQVRPYGNDESSAFVREDEPLPSPWVAVMEDRAGMRKWVISDIVRNMLDRGAPHHLKHSTMGDMTGKRVVFDGHCLTWLDVMRMEGFVGQEIFETVPGGEQRRVFSDGVALPDDEAKKTPLVVEYATAHERRVYFAPRFRNELGESDFSAFWYARDPSGLGAAAGARVQINACDVDLLYLALAFYAKECGSGDGPKLSIRTGFPSASAPRHFIPDGEKASQRKETYVDIGALSRRISHAAGVRHHAAPAPALSGALSFACSMVSAGSDYTESFEGVSHASFFAAATNHAAYIGPLVSVGSRGGKPSVCVDGRAFFKLVKAAYCERYASTLVSFKNFSFSDMTTKAVKKMVQQGNAKFPEKQLPGVKALLGRLGNLWYYAIMMSQVAEPRLVLPEGHELLLYGYGTGMRASDMTPMPGRIEKSNIRRTCNDELISIKIKKAKTADAKRAAPCAFPERLPGEDV